MAIKRTISSGFWWQVVITVIMLAPLILLLDCTVRPIEWSALYGKSEEVKALPQTPAGPEKPDTNDWPVFRGNALQNGIAVSSLPDQLEVRWKFETKDSIEGAAAIVNGTVYIGSLDENLYAIDLATGKEKWHYKAGATKAAPGVRDNAVYIGNEDGQFHCVDAGTGTKRWTFETGGEIVGGANFAGENILFGSYADQNLYSLSRDGKLVWKFETGGPVNGSPAVVEDRTFVAGCDGSLHILDTAQGKELAAVDLGSPAGATAAVSGDQLFVGTISSHQVLAIDWKKASILWTFEAAKRANDYYASAAVTDQLVVVGSRDKHVYSLERQTGKQVWTFPTGGRVDSSPVVVGQRVFVGSEDGNLYVLDLAKGTELKHFELGKGITAAPAVAENCLVIGTQEGVVYCLGGK